MKNPMSSPRFAGLVAALATVLSLTANAQYTPVWFDGYDTSGNSTDINFENATRQGGAVAPIAYTANTADPANDFRHQLQAGTSPNALQLAQVASASSTLASPLFIASGPWGADILGKKITLDLDANTFVAPTHFSQAGITIGGNAPLIGSGTAGGGFSVMLVQDTFAVGLATPNFIRIWDGDTMLADLLPNPAGTGLASIELIVEDFGDGNPWDGVGSTSIGVSINGTSLGTYTKGGGGYTANVITLEGTANFVGLDLATHAFDNLTVWSGPATVVPEPSTFALVGLGVASLMVRRSRRA